jgi:hypothetical protein
MFAPFFCSTSIAGHKDRKPLTVMMTLLEENLEKKKHVRGDI